MQNQSLSDLEDRKDQKERIGEKNERPDASSGKRVEWESIGWGQARQIPTKDGSQYAIVATWTMENTRKQRIKRSKIQERKKKVVDKSDKKATMPRPSEQKEKKSEQKESSKLVWTG